MCCSSQGSTTPTRTIDSSDKLASTVWRNTLILHYEIPKWDADLVPPTHYVEVSEANARRKVELLNLSFPTQQTGTGGMTSSSWG